MKQLLTTVLCLTAFGQLHAEIRWNDTFTENYRSEADGADVAFNVHTPPHHLHESHAQQEPRGLRDLVGPGRQRHVGFDFNHLLSYDPDSYTLADFRTQHRICETTLGSVTGAELKEIWTRWGQKQELHRYATFMSRCCSNWD